MVREELQAARDELHELQTAQNEVRMVKGELHDARDKLHNKAVLLDRALTGRKRGV